MKSYNHLFEQFISAENYEMAVKNATKHKNGKRKKYRKAKFYKEHYKDIETKMLRFASNYKNDRHVPVEIYDGIRRKKRTIIVPTMREQIVHHMIVNVMKPIWMKSMYEHSYGSIPDRGGHKGKHTIEKWISNNDKNMKYCLKMDIKKYFDSVPHEIIKRKIHKQIHDKRFADIVCTVVDAVPEGLPLGFYTSQWLANWYLTELDHYIKERLKAKYYMRYMDDMVIFGSNKRVLHDMRGKIQDYLQENLGLSLKDNWQVFLFDYVDKDGNHHGRDLDFMGFRFFRDRTILRKSIMLKATRKAKRVCKKRGKTIHDSRQMLSYLGWIDATDTYAMYKRRIKPFVSFRYLRKKESRYQIAKNRRELCSKKQNTQTNQAL